MCHTLYAIIPIEAIRIDFRGFCIQLNVCVWVECMCVGSTTRCESSSF